MDSTFGLKDLDIGDPIAKGCSAAVYAAALKVPATADTTTAAELVAVVGSPPPPQRETFPSIQNTSRFVHNFGGSVDNVNFAHTTSQMDLDLLSSPRMAQRQFATQRARFDSINESEYEHVMVVSNETAAATNETTESRNANERVSKLGSFIRAANLTLFENSDQNSPPTK